MSTKSKAQFDHNSIELTRVAHLLKKLIEFLNLQVTIIHLLLIEKIEKQKYALLV